MIRIDRTNSNFEREPLVAPFGFKGACLTELWQGIALLESGAGHIGLGLGTQSTLWSDANVFTGYSEAAGNGVMFLMTEYALRMARGMEFDTPPELLDQLLPPVFDYGKAVSRNPDLRLTFALNSLVAVDNAAWQLYAAELEIDVFDEIIPEEVRPALSHGHDKLACVPLVTYGIPIDDVLRLVDCGCCLLKIKIGSDPDKDGDLDKMLEWDKQRLGSIHAAVNDCSTPYTNSGHVAYYLDANGRYDSKERLMRLLDHADRIGALERVILLEEPFSENLTQDVSDIPARLVADESAHSDKHAIERIDMGYRAIALKPIAKTMSMSFKIAKIAHDRAVPCFCADLTVNPILVDWNKCVAAKLAPLPGMKTGVLESNGYQNYANWERMKTYHPSCGAPWLDIERGMFRLDEEFYSQSGGIFAQSKHYLSMVD